MMEQYYLHSFRTLGNIVTGNDSQTDAVLAAQVILPSLLRGLVQCRLFNTRVIKWHYVHIRLTICTPGSSCICQAAAAPQDEHSEGGCLDHQQHHCWKQYSNPGSMKLFSLRIHWLAIVNYDNFKTYLMMACRL